MWGKDRRVIIKEECEGDWAQRVANWWMHTFSPLHTRDQAGRLSFPRASAREKFFALSLLRARKRNCAEN